MAAENQNKYPSDKRDSLNYGNYFFLPGAVTPTYDYQVRTYQGNVLTQLSALKAALNERPDNQDKPASPDNPIVVC